MNVPVLTGRWVKLEPLGEQHREGLRLAADDVRIWEFTLTRAQGPEFDRWFDDALAACSAGRQIPFAVRRLDDEALIGSTSYLDVVPRHKRLEIGSTWYVPAVWQSRVNPECKLLLLAHAFEGLGFNRVTFCTDLLNVRSQAAIAKLGAVREGVLRAHAVTQGERVRDTVVFGIVRADWPEAKARLLQRLSLPESGVRSQGSEKNPA
jgi:RimJ/RimL family protein N-acetyltransferase